MAPTEPVENAAALGALVEELEQGPAKALQVGAGLGYRYDGFMGCDPWETIPHIVWRPAGVWKVS